MIFLGRCEPAITNSHHFNGIGWQVDRYPVEHGFRTGALPDLA
jgi:hypothetical protein